MQDIKDVAGYDTVSANVIISVRKLDESKSGFLYNFIQITVVLLTSGGSITGACNFITD